MKLDGKYVKLRKNEAKLDFCEQIPLRVMCKLLPSSYVGFKSYSWSKNTKIIFS